MPEPSAAVDRSAAGSRAVLWIQCRDYRVTGVWPLVSIRTFVFVTGPKFDHLPTGQESDHWLVMTVAVLIVAIALGLLTAAVRRTYSTEIRVVAMAAAAGLLGIDGIYVSRGVIAPVYLVDAVLQSGFLAAWAMTLCPIRLARTTETARPA